VARKTQMIRNGKPRKFKVRNHNRCPRCGRTHSVIRDFNMCRICFRTLALEGKIPGVTKASW
jgi:small subunit ribosomal protein S14